MEKGKEGRKEIQFKFPFLRAELSKLFLKLLTIHVKKSEQA